MKRGINRKKRDLWQQGPEQNTLPPINSQPANQLLENTEQTQHSAKNCQRKQSTIGQHRRWGQTKTVSRGECLLVDDWLGLKWGDVSELWIAKQYEKRAAAAGGEEIGRPWRGDKEPKKSGPIGDDNYGKHALKSPHHKRKVLHLPSA